MARIAGVDLPNDKRVEIALCYIFGVGRTLSNKILATCGIDPDTRVKNLTETEVSKSGTPLKMAIPSRVTCGVKSP